MPTITFTGDELTTLAAFAAQVNSSLYPAPGDVEAAARIPNTHFTRLKSIIDKLEAGIEASTDALAVRVANTIYAGPSAGADAAATFRALVAADVPLLTSAKISDFATAAAAAAPVQSVAGRGGAVVLAVADVAGLQTALDGKSATGHGHAAGDITSGTLGIARGGTGLSSIAGGKILFASALDTLAELTVGTGLEITGSTLNCTVSGGGIDGSGTGGNLAKWSDTDTLTDSLLSETGGNVVLASGQFLGPTSAAGLPTFATSAQPDSGLWIPSNGAAALMGNGHAFAQGDGQQYIYLRPTASSANIAFYYDGFFAPDSASVDLGGGGEAGGTLNRFRSVNLGGNTVTASRAPLDIAQTWNAGAATFTAAKVNITDTASAAASRLFDLQVASSSVFSVRKDGAVLLSDGSETDPSLTFLAQDIGFYRSGNGRLGFTNGNYLTVEFEFDGVGFGAHGSDFQIGLGGGRLTSTAIPRTLYDSASKRLYVLGHHNSGTDASGGSLEFHAGYGTGTGLAGSIVFSGSNPGSTGTARNTAVERARFLPSGHLRLSELSTDPGTGDLTSLAHIAVYMKNDKLVFAYNNGGNVTYLSIPLDGATTTWTHSTSAP